MWDVFVLQSYAFSWARLVAPDLCVFWDCNYLAAVLNFAFLDLQNLLVRPLFFFITNYNQCGGMTYDRTDRRDSPPIKSDESVRQAIGDQYF